MQNRLIIKVIYGSDDVSTLSLTYVCNIYVLPYLVRYGVVFVSTSIGCVINRRERSEGRRADTTDRFLADLRTSTADILVQRSRTLQSQEENGSSLRGELSNTPRVKWQNEIYNDYYYYYRYGNDITIIATIFSDI